MGSLLNICVANAYGRALLSSARLLQLSLMLTISMMFVQPDVDCHSSAMKPSAGIHDLVGVTGEV